MYAVLVIAAILLSSAPMHAHAFLAAVLPAGNPSTQFVAVSTSGVRYQAPVKRTAPHHPAPVAFTRPSSAPAPQPIPASSARIVPLPTALSPHAPNAP